MSLPQVRPIIPTSRREPFDDPGWLFDLKYDGYRGLCYIEQTRCRFLSRNANLLSRFDALGDQLATTLPVANVILDESDRGRRDGTPAVLRPHPAHAGARLHGVRYSVADGTDLRSMPLSERRKRLQAISPPKSPIISEAISVIGRGRKLFELICSNDLEGIVAKQLEDPYEPRVQWLKIKNPAYSRKEGRADLFNGPRQRPAHSGLAVTSSYTGSSMTLGNAAAARVRLIVWCKACGTGRA